MKKEILKTLEEHLLLIDGEYDRAEEIASLKEQILFIKKEIWKEERSAYVEQLKAFKNHMSNCYDVLMWYDCTPESCNLFYNSDFVVTFRGKSVRLANGADVFNGIEELIQFEISEYEED